MTTTTTQPPRKKGSEIAREVFAAMNPKQRFYASAIDLNRRDAEEMRRAALKELRQAFRDGTVVGITVVFLYDDAEVVQ